MQKTSWLFLLLLVGLGALAAYQALNDAPAVMAIVRFFGLGGFGLLCTSLMIGPLVVFYPKEMAPLLEPRRAIGIAAGVFILIHFTLLTALYFNWNLGTMLSFMPNILAAPALIITAALTLTSCDYAIRKLGITNWKTLQRFAYLVFVIAFAHFLLHNNGLTSTPINLSEIAMVLLGLITVALQLAGFVKKRSKPEIKVESKTTETTPQ